MINYEQVRQLFNYKDGDLYWKTPKCPRIKPGDLAGTTNRRGYRIIHIQPRRYYAHRLIWLWFHGYFPEHDIDHVDGDPSNNHIENLREVTRQCNLRNCGNRIDNTSGVRGVYEQDNRWVAQIAVNRKTYHLGMFKDFDEAVLARLNAEWEFNWENCNDSSPAYLYAKEKGLIP